MARPLKTPKPPTFVAGVIGSAIPLAIAIIVASIGGLLVYMFWFGAEWILNGLFN